jgi:hypothetical protein
MGASGQHPATAKDEAAPSEPTARPAKHHAAKSEAARSAR